MLLRKRFHTIVSVRTIYALLPSCLNRTPFLALTVHIPLDQIKQKQKSDTHTEFDRLIPSYLSPTLFHKAVGKKKFHRSFGLLLNTL